jgi:hypothetical protein
LVFLTPVDSSKIESLKESGLLVSSLKKIEKLEKELNINGKTKEDPNQETSHHRSRPRQHD